MRTEPTAHPSWVYGCLHALFPVCQCLHDTRPLQHAWCGSVGVQWRRRNEVPAARAHYEPQSSGPGLSLSLKKNDSAPEQRNFEIRLVDRNSTSLSFFIPTNNPGKCLLIDCRNHPEILINQQNASHQLSITSNITSISDVLANTD